MNSEYLKSLQSKSLEEKIIMTKERITQWYDYWNGLVCISFSGGKDSTVLLHIARSIYPDLQAIFVDTGLEYPEIRQFVKKISNVKWLRPQMSFSKVIKKYGYPIISKQQARYISDVQNTSDRNKATCNLRLTGFNRRGIYCPSMRISKKWIPLTKAPFKVSSYCCDIIKKKPLKKYHKKHNLHPMIGIMAEDSRQRQLHYYNHGCNNFKSSDPVSWPLSFWTTDDIWEYIKRFNVPYSKIYDMGESRTGCMFCLFGVHLEKEPNRFQRMKNTHPKQYDFCINKLGCGDVLDFIGVNY
jgi:3'-phosphoadenosine 5'-phosphosulfate sulfotransferase (PAPS reductase)/FAD synthetase